MKLSCTLFFCLFITTNVYADHGSQGGAESLIVASPKVLAQGQYEISPLLSTRYNPEFDQYEVYLGGSYAFGLEAAQVEISLGYNEADDSIEASIGAVRKLLKEHSYLGNLSWQAQANLEHTFDDDEFILGVSSAFLMSRQLNDYGLVFNMNLGVAYEVDSPKQDGGEHHGMTTFKQRATNYHTTADDHHDEKPIHDDDHGDEHIDDHDDEHGDDHDRDDDHGDHFGGTLQTHRHRSHGLFFAGGFTLPLDNHHQTHVGSPKHLYAFARSRRLRDENGQSYNSAGGQLGIRWDQPRRAWVFSFGADRERLTHDSRDLDTVYRLTLSYSIKRKR